jgi:hypothetical protein
VEDEVAARGWCPRRDAGSGFIGLRPDRVAWSVGFMVGRQSSHMGDARLPRRAHDRNRRISHLGRDSVTDEANHKPAGSWSTAGSPEPGSYDGNRKVVRAADLGPMTSAGSMSAPTIAGSSAAGRPTSTGSPHQPPPKFNPPGLVEAILQAAAQRQRKEQSRRDRR